MNQRIRNNQLVNSEDMPDPDEVAFYIKSAEETWKEVTSEQCDHPCE